jgi:hypothetical protein
MNTFTAEVNKFVAKSQKAMEAVFKQSAQDVILEAQTPMAKGGNMRIDTGFLRASGKASINRLPIGATTNFGSNVEWDDNITVLTINKAKIGDAVVFGWTANYAQYRENQDGFVRLAAQNWGQIVNKNANKIKARLK